MKKYGIKYQDLDDKVLLYLDFKDILLSLILDINDKMLYHKHLHDQLLIQYILKHSQKNYEDQPSNSFYVDK